VRWEPGGGLHFGPTGLAYVEGESLPGLSYSNLTILMHFLPETRENHRGSERRSGLTGRILVGMNGNQVVVDIHNGAQCGTVDRGKRQARFRQHRVTVYSRRIEEEAHRPALLADSSLEKYPLCLVVAVMGVASAGVVYTAPLDRTGGRRPRDPERLIAGAQPFAFL
jgi:hypothetical protein